MGQIVFYTLNDDDKRVRGALPRNTYPAIVVDDHGGNVYTFVVFTGTWHDPLYVRSKVPNGAAGTPGSWNALAA